MLRKVLYVILGLMAIALIGGLTTDEAEAACDPATDRELSIVSDFGAQADSGWRLEREGHTFVAVPVPAGTAVFGYGALIEGNKPIWAAVNDAARSVSEQGVDIPAGSDAATTVGLDDAEGITAAESCAA